jgi:CHASE3 domain sensor protein
VNSSIDALRDAARLCRAVAGRWLNAATQRGTRGTGWLRARLPSIDPRWLAGTGVLVLVVGVVMVGKLAQRSQGHVMASTRNISRSMEVEKRAEDLLAAILAAEQGVRSTVVSGEPAEAVPFHAAVDTVPDAARALRELTRTNPDQMAYVDQLAAIANESLDLLRRAVAVNDAGDREAALALLLSGRVPRLFDALRSASALIVLEEQRALAVRQERLASEAALGRALLVLVGIVTTVFVVSLWTVALRLSRLRRLARMCAWSRKIEYDGEWLSVEEYLSRRYNTDVTHGISPAEADKMRAGQPPG